MVKVHPWEYEKIIEVYNKDGKSAAYAFIKGNYGINNAYSLIQRIKESSDYVYNRENDRFETSDNDIDDKLFMSLEDLCGETPIKQASVKKEAAKQPSSMEKLINELISDRLLELSRYITLETASRTILIDKTSMIQDGYKVVTH